MTQEKNNLPEKKKPTFVRHAAHRKKRLAAVWRRPKGLHNKLRLNKKSRGIRVSSGYGSARATRGLVNGRKQVVVRSVDEMALYEPETHALVIGKVGNKKRAMLLEEAKKHKFTVLNHNPEEKLKTIKEELGSRTSTRKEREVKRKEQEKLAEEAAKNKAKQEAKAETKTEDSQDEESKKAQVKKEQEKVLTKKDQQN